MSLKLTWADLIIEDFEPKYAFNCLGGWAWLVSEQVAPVFLSKFGIWYLQRPDGTTHELDVLSGTLSVIADSPEEFRARVNTQEWQEEHLLSRLVYELHQQGKVPGPGRCFAAAPQPVFGGRLEPSFITIMDIHVWQSICQQSLQQACGSPKGAEGQPRGKWWQFWRREGA